MSQIQILLRRSEIQHSSKERKIADNIDIAQPNKPNQIRGDFKNYNIPLLKECERCGEDIPVQRQKLGAVKLCIAYATHAEK